jgi:type II secretory pathway pseudopilin PulG
MKFATASTKASQRAGGFTLAEVLAAMLFLALVIPAAVEALHVATLSGEVAVRKCEAARVADRVLNQSVVMTNWTSGTQNGTITEGTLDFQWQVTAQNWPRDAMQLLTADVTFMAQNKPYTVSLWTLANVQTTPGTTATPGAGAQP